jgi:transposase
MKLTMPTEAEIRAAYKEGEDAVVALFYQITSQVIEISEALAKQTTAIKQRQAQAAKNSRNSGKPPSSDGYSKPNVNKRTTSQRKKSGKATGGQPGHKGHTLKFAEKSDHTQIHEVDEKCQQCGCSLKEEQISGHEKRQVYDIPQIHIEITTHQAEIKICPACGIKNKGKFPTAVSQPTQYGNGVKTWASYFSTQHYLPTARISQVFEDLIGHKISEASVLKSCNERSEKTVPTMQAIRAILLQSPVICFDESGIRVAGKLHWLHNASTNTVTYYIVDPKRGQIAIDKMDILPHDTGTACHDHWKPYFSYDNCKHSLCNAHPLRELDFLEKQHQQSFAPKMADLLIEINKAKYACEADTFPTAILEDYQQRYNNILTEGFNANPEKPPDPNQKRKRGATKQSPAYNMLRRLNNFKTSVLAFMYDFQVPFTNNQAEQDVRMIKVKLKVSGCFQRLTGAEVFVTNRAYLSTVRKNGMNVFQSINDAFEGHPFIPQA